MTVEKRAITFECEGDSLVGILSIPPNCKPVGLLTLVAGGPQYRAGCGRQLVEMSEALNSEGFPVMRFDYRGIGDSTGEYQDIRAIEPDIRSAIECFKSSVPRLERIVLWGGCNAASASLIHGAKFPEVASMIAGNPFVGSQKTKQAVQRQHYAQRLRDPAFWKKLFSGGFNFLEYARGLFKSILRHLKPEKPKTGQNASTEELMLHGLQAFNGTLLLLMSGQSLTSREFDVLVNNSPPWQKQLERISSQRINIPDADQAFSTQQARHQIIKAACEWMNSL